MYTYISTSMYMYMCSRVSHNTPPSSKYMYTLCTILEEQGLLAGCKRTFKLPLLTRKVNLPISIFCWCCCAGLFVCLFVFNNKGASPLSGYIMYIHITPGVVYAKTQTKVHTHIYIVHLCNQFLVHWTAIQLPVELLLTFHDNGRSPSSAQCRKVARSKRTSPAGCGRDRLCSSRAPPPRAPCTRNSKGKENHFEPLWFSIRTL